MLTIHDNMPRYTAIHRDTQRYTAIHSDTQRYTAIHSDTQRYTAIQYNTVYQHWGEKQVFRGGKGGMPGRGGLLFAPFSLYT